MSRMCFGCGGTVGDDQAFCPCSPYYKAATRNEKGGDGMLPFGDNGVDRKELSDRLNVLWAASRGATLEEQETAAKCAAAWTQAVNNYDALCAGVNRSIGNAFKDEGQEPF